MRIYWWLQIVSNRFESLVIEITPSNVWQSKFMVHRATYIESTELTRETATRPRVCLERWSVLIVSRGNVIILIRIASKEYFNPFFPGRTLIYPSFILYRPSTIFFVNFSKNLLESKANIRATKNQLEKVNQIYLFSNFSFRNQAW